MGGFVRRHPFWVYYALALGTATLVWIYIMAMEMILASGNDGFSLVGAFYNQLNETREANPILHHHRDSVLLYVSTYLTMPIAFAGFFFPFAPTLAALLSISIGWGWRGLVALIGAYLPVRGAISLQEGLRIYATLIAFIVLTVAAIILREYFFGDPARVGHYLEHLGIIDWRHFAGAWLVAMFLNQGALLEELGWRGFALPVLIRRLGSPLIASLALGTAWALWHFPREVPTLLAGQQTIDDLLIGQVLFITSCCAMSIVATYFVNITGGSVLPVIIIHGMLNFVGGMFSAGQVGARSAFSLEGPMMWGSAAILLLILVGPDLGWKRRLAVHGGDGSSDPSLLWSGR